MTGRDLDPTLLRLLGSDEPDTVRSVSVSCSTGSP